MRLSARYERVQFWVVFSYILFAILAIYLAAGIVTASSGPLQRGPSALLEIIPYAAIIVIPLALMIGVGTLFIMPRLKREISTHEAYLNGAPVPLVLPQPTLDEQNIEELVIQWKGARLANLISLLFGLLVLGVIVLLWYMQIHSLGASFSAIIQIVIWTYVGISFIRIFMQQLFSLALPSSQTTVTPFLRADNEGLALSVREKIIWREARIFARVGTYSRDPHLAYYELVDDKQSLTFAVALRPPSRFVLVRPATSFEEYEQQTQQLLGMIATKIGLPLVDLRSR